MNIDFIYQKHIDLVFHILAHIKVNNSSDLFSKPYIEKMRLAIQDDKISLPQSAVNYYNQNFNRLGIMNFLPFFTQNMEELIQLLRDYNRFNENDKVFFVYPFVDVLTRHSTKYFEFWDKQFHKEKANRLLIEETLRNKINQYSFLFDYYKKSAKAWLSFSITKNGRGIGISDCFSVAVPYPLDIDKLDNTFFMLLHEFTHQFTDIIINADINMDDGSHDLSETIVMLTDYYLIKNICKSDVTPYLSWLAPKGDETYIDEDLFLKIFKVSEPIQQGINKIVEQLLNSCKL